MELASDGLVRVLGRGRDEHRRQGEGDEGHVYAVRLGFRGRTSQPRRSLVNSRGVAVTRAQAVFYFL